MRFPRFVVVFTLSLAAAVLGCGAAAPAPPEVAAAPPKERNAATIAWDIVHAKVGALTYVERVRGRPIAARIQSLDLFRPYLEGTGLDPERDLDRAFVAAPATDRGDESIVVAQHHLSSDQIRAALGAMITSGRVAGEWIQGASVPEARVTARGQTRILAIIEPDILVLLPEAHALEAGRFINTGGFPEPEGQGAVFASAIDPANSIRGPRIPAIPPSISSLRGIVTLGDDGGATIAIEGPSASPEQAVADAAALSRAVDDATSIRVAFIRVRVFKPIHFIADADKVKTDVHLSAGEIDTLVGAAAAFIPK
ncbi:MAG: hypothetical protein ABJE95_02535 [Byssovorax sp.]